MSTSIGVIQRYALGVRNITRYQEYAGNGARLIRPGTGGTMASGITGAFQGMVSLTTDGVGTKATGIMEATSIGIADHIGTASKIDTGSDTRGEFQSTHQNQDQRYAVPFTGWRKPAHPPQSPTNMCQDAEWAVTSTCTGATEVASSLEEKRCTKRDLYAKLASNTSG